MKVEQIYSIVNSTAKQFLGETVVIKEDLSNIVDIGKSLFDATSVDNYVKALVDHIGKVIFVNRPYVGTAPSVLMDAWEFGSILEKVQGEIPEAVENHSWDLEDKKSYDPNIFYKPSASMKLFNSKVTFEIPLSFTEMQIKSAFNSAEQLNGFISMTQTNVEKSMTIRLDNLIRSTINSMTADTLYDAFYDEDTNPTGAVVPEVSTSRAVNLLKLYNDQYGTNLPADEVMTTPEFIRFAVMIMKNYVARLSQPSRLFNMGAKVRFTPEDLLHIVMLNDFKTAAEVYLQADTYNEKFTKLPESESLPFWQGSGTDYNFSAISSINVVSGSGHAMNASGILGVMFDRDALGVSNLNRRVTSSYNPAAEFYTNFYKMDAGYFNDSDENFVVFFVA